MATKRTLRVLDDKHCADDCPLLDEARGTCVLLRGSRRWCLGYDSTAAAYWRSGACLRRQHHERDAVGTAATQSVALPVAYSEADDRAAKREGWALFATDDGTIQIQKLDEGTPFDSDGEAVAFVVDGAASGCTRHLRALFLAGRTVDTETRVYLDGRLGR